MSAQHYTYNKAKEKKEMMENYSLSDIAAITKDGGGTMGSGFGLFWLFALLILAGGGFGGLGGANKGELGQYATAASQQDILFTQKFDALSQKINQIGDGLCSSTYALNNSITNEGRALAQQLSNCCCDNQRNTDALRYDISQMFAQSNANTTAQTQKILDAMAQNKIESLQAEVNNLKTQNMFCGIPRINPYGYGVYQYANGCGCNNF